MNPSWEKGMIRVKEDHSASSPLHAASRSASRIRPTLGQSAWNDLRGLFWGTTVPKPALLGNMLVINNLDPAISGQVQTVRSAFEEGDEAFPGAALKKETHIQVAVRDPECILGIFRPSIEQKPGEQ